MGQIDYWRWPGIRITLSWIVVGMVALLKLFQVCEYLDQSHNNSFSQLEIGDTTVGGSSLLLGIAEILFEGGIVIVLLLAYIAWEYSRLKGKRSATPGTTK